jgi:hypothetical protein
MHFDQLFQFKNEANVISVFFHQTYPLSFDARNVSSGTKYGIQSYEIPPPPRPLHGPGSPHYAPAPVQQQTTPSPASSPIYNLSIEVFFHLLSILQI